MSYIETYDQILRANPRVRCVGCGRNVSADMLRNYQKLPDAIRPADFACDACGERMVAKGKISRADVAFLLGADRGVIAKAEAMDESQPAAKPPPDTEAVMDMLHDDATKVDAIARA